MKKVHKTISYSIFNTKKIAEGVTPHERNGASVNMDMNDSALIFYFWHPHGFYVAHHIFVALHFVQT